MDFLIKFTLMVEVMNFEELWLYALSLEKHRNYVAYHRCCDVWTSRNAKKARTSHSETINWRELIKSFDQPFQDKKVLLQAKMVEEQWSIPVILNQSCRSAFINKKKKNKGKINMDELPFKLVNEVISESGLQRLANGDALESIESDGNNFLNKNRASQYRIKIFL